MNNSTIELSIIICTYNRADSLKETLNSLKSQDTGKNNYEIVVVDNNSNDSTKEIVYKLMPFFNNKLKYIFEKKQGLSNARNAGIKESLGKILAFTDDDVIVNTNYINNILKRIGKINKECVLAGKTIPLWIEDKPNWLHWEGPFSFLGPILSFDLGNKFIQLTTKNPIPIGANMIFHKELFNKYGEFNRNLGRCGSSLIGGEDKDIFLKLFKYDVPIFYDPNIIVQHKIDHLKLSKKYFIDWSYWTGYSVTIVSPYITTSKIGIPNWLIKNLFKYLILWIFYSIKFNTKIAFFMKLQFLLTYGYIRGNLKYYAENKCNSSDI